MMSFLARKDRWHYTALRYKDTGVRCRKRGSKGVVVETSRIKVEGKVQLRSKRSGPLRWRKDCFPDRHWKTPAL